MNAMPHPLANRKHWVYRCFDDDGQLLYVGCTTDMAVRFRGHRSSKSATSKALTQRMASYTAEAYPNRTSAFAAERQAIATERPLLNVAGNPTRRDAYAGPTVRMMREAHGVSAARLAEMVGLTADEVVEIESGRSSTTSDLLNRICDVIATLPIPRERESA